MEILGYMASAAIGLSLGLIGGGGSILTVPVLVYLFHLDPVLATAYSLFIVGTTSSVGAIQKMRNKAVNFKVFLLFGIPSLATVYLFRKIIVPLIPNIILKTDFITVTKGGLVLILFAVLMVFAAWAMLKREKVVEHDTPIKSSKLITQGLLVGVISGLLGAGGGFVIIPSLILFAKLDIKKAIGTSLLIIAVNSLIGFIGDLSHTAMDWKILLAVTALATVGIFVGNYFSGSIQSNKLKKGFGWFVLVMGAFIILKELFFN
ncbi:sulfite exporter TauE/SafE family protein [Solitalea koreensis]|uniref:Probable membrane transporter protein n=1 Tax=Solitalea koreensis TaxID=543615 RepID=A0A521D2Y1_9SPHI|nr:sulfite exporter TauE/SafE family protein [Solitalea koreensis]SMO66002.1 hypothetical protein SAMN06265350_105217 [Solitalea koreensis]